MALPEDLVSLAEAMGIATRDRGIDLDVWIDALVEGEVPTWKVGGGTRIRRLDAQTYSPRQASPSRSCRPFHRRSAPGSCAHQQVVWLIQS